MQQREVLITSDNPYRLQDLVVRERGRRAIVVRRPVAEVAPGTWGVLVTQLRPIRPTWVRPAAVATGVMTILGGLGWLAWMAVNAVVAAAAGVSLATVVGILAVTGVILRLTRPRGCQTTVTIRHRHR